MQIFRKPRSIGLRDIEPGHFLSALGHQRKQHVHNSPWEGATLVGTGVQGAVPCVPTAAARRDVRAAAWAGLPRQVHPEELGSPAAGRYGTLRPTLMFSKTSFFGPSFPLKKKKKKRMVFLFLSVANISGSLHVGSRGSTGLCLPSSSCLSRVRLLIAAPGCPGDWETALHWWEGGDGRQLCPVGVYYKE